MAEYIACLTCKDAGWVLDARRELDDPNRLMVCPSCHNRKPRNWGPADDAQVPWAERGHRR